MTKGKFLTGLVGVLISFLLLGCAKENGNPTIKFIPGPGFTGKDTIIRVNYTLPVSLEVNWNGSDVLELLDVRFNDESLQTFNVDGEKASFNLNIVKGTDDLEKWTFVIIDSKDNQSSIDLQLTRDPNSEYGPVLYYASIILGAQNNIVKPAFISFQTQPATTYNLDQAYVSQSMIDLLYYFDQSTQATLASPGSDLPENLYPGSRSIAGWSVRPLSKFLKTTLTAQDFSNIANDAVIINAWNETLSVSKAGDLKMNEVWLIKTQSGKKGAILIKQAGSADTGEMEFAIKIQK